MEPSGIKVVDAEPQSNPSASANNSGLNPNVLLNNTLDGLANFSSKINPFAQKLGKGIGQVRQVNATCYRYYFLLNSSFGKKARPFLYRIEYTYLVSSLNRQF
jgi:hypothetical protein